MANKVYLNAEARLIAAIHDVLLSTHPLFGPAQKQTLKHSGPIRNVRSPVIVDQPLTTSTSRMLFSFDSIRSTDIDEFASQVSQALMNLVEQMKTHFLASINEVAETIGNTVSRRDYPDEDSLLAAAIDKCHIEFDADGNHGFGAIVDGLPMPLDQYCQSGEWPKTQASIEKKKKEFYAAKPNRKLY